MKTIIPFLFVCTVTISFLLRGASAAGFVKFDGIDGESKDADHDKWIDVLSIDWGAQKPGGGGAARRRKPPKIKDLVLTFQYDKASPKLQEACLKGQMIPTVLIEQTGTYGGTRATYLKYELKNVLITSFSINSSSSGGTDVFNGAEDPPIMQISTKFKEVRVTYTEYDREGSSKGNIEYTWKVEKASARRNIRGLVKEEEENFDEDFQDEFDEDEDFGEESEEEVVIDVF